jgi:hypothetical protein
MAHQASQAEKIRTISSLVKGMVGRIETFGRIQSSFNKVEKSDLSDEKQRTLK